MGGLSRSGSFKGRRRTRPRPPKSAPRRAWSGPRALLAAFGRSKTRPKARSDRPWDAPVARGSSDGARSQRRTLARAIGRRILIVFRVSRDSADVRSVPFFTVFCCLRTKYAPNARTQSRRAEIQAFRPPKTAPRAAKTPRNRARAARASAKTEVQPHFFSQVRPTSRKRRVRTRQERKLERFKPGQLPVPRALDWEPSKGFRNISKYF